MQQDKEVMRGIVGETKRAFGTFFVGCGSSYHACLARGKSESHSFKRILERYWVSMGLHRCKYACSKGNRVFSRGKHGDIRDLR